MAKATSKPAKGKKASKEKEVEKVKKDKKAKGKDLSPLEKARLARKNGTGKKKAKTKSNLKTWKIPEEFKNFHAVILFKTEKDGMLGNQLKVMRFKGKPESGNDNWDMSTYDPKTVNGVAARLGAVLFHPTGRETKSGPTRLPAKTAFMLKCYVSKVKGDQLKAVVKEVSVQIEKNGKKKFKVLDNKEVFCRKIRKVNKYFAAAFKDTVLPPKPQKRKRAEADDE